MAERKAKLAIVVRRCRRVIIVRRRYYSRRAWRRERVRVMVPSPEHGLEKGCKDAEKGRFLAQSPPSSADPNPCGHAQRHVDFPSGPYRQQARPTSSFWRCSGVDEQDMVGDRPNKSTVPSEECRLNEFFSSVNYFTVFDLRLDYSARRGWSAHVRDVEYPARSLSGGFDPRTHWAMNCPSAVRPTE
jgi:hypothetical protein